MAVIVLDARIRQLVEEAKKAAETDPMYLIDMLKACGRK